AGLLAVASVGNVLGSVLNYVLGRLSDKIVGKRWSKRDDGKLARARAFYRKYGRWSLLLSWVPIIGDPITVVAGILREPLWSFLLLVTVAKVGRYLVLAGATLSAF
ncbi:MAG: YqaA family protein, partial [Pseudomonadota bacterium]